MSAVFMQVIVIDVFHGLALAMQACVRVSSFIMSEFLDY